MDVRIWFTIFVVLPAGSFQALQPGNWKSCQNGEMVSTRTNTSMQVGKLREKMQEIQVDVYIVPTADFHLSEFVSGYDKRREYISGFTGSMGTAVITKTHLALWTVGKYFLQAEAELGCDWILMREGEPEVLSIEEWIVDQMANTSGKRVGACPFFFGINKWIKMESDLQDNGVQVVSIQTDLIDQIWTDGRPEKPMSALHQVEDYAGLNWKEKVWKVREQMQQKNADVVVVSMLDEVAWLFNLRGADITGLVNDPFFFSVAVITADQIWLYVTDSTGKLNSELGRYNGTLRTYLDMVNTNLQVKEYRLADILSDMRNLALSADVNKVLLSYFCNYAIYSNIPNEKVIVDNTPVALLKVQKNPTEVEGMTNCHIRDAAALARFASKLEKGVLAGETWTEISAADELVRFRSLQELNRGVSFDSISASGSNAAIIHYFPTDKTDTKIVTGATYLIDSGGQYLDGTTDVTRTFYWGEDPPAFVKECYTRVLMGQIDLAMAIWVKGLFGREIDMLARKPLFEVGLQYRHGTGHGIGAYLSVHEGPARISNYHPRFEWDVPLDERMFFSDEPGYYQEDEFGIRLENIVYVKKVSPKHINKMTDVTFLGFETITLFPYETHMIDFSLLSDEQKDWLDAYNARVLEKVGSLLKKQGDMEAYKWLEKRTRSVEHYTSSSSFALPCFTTVAAVLLLLCVL